VQNFIALLGPDSPLAIAPENQRAHLKGFAHAELWKCDPGTDVNIFSSTYATSKLDSGGVGSIVVCFVCTSKEGHGYKFVVVARTLMLMVVAATPLEAHLQDCKAKVLQLATRIAQEGA
jgi:hypothetical protein